MVVNRAMSSLDGEETTPLLQASRSLNLKATPLPVQAIFVLCVMRASEPIALSVIFPFINQVSTFEILNPTLFTVHVSSRDFFTDHLTSSDDRGSSYRK